MYEALAKSLKWSDYFQLLKSLLYRLTRVAAKANLAKAENAVDEGTQEQEKTVTKCLCRVLNGFHFEQVQDSLELFLKEDSNDPMTGDQLLGMELEQVFKAV